MREGLAALETVNTEIDSASIAPSKQGLHCTSLYHVRHTFQTPYGLPYPFIPKLGYPSCRHVLSRVGNHPFGSPSTKGLLSVPELVARATGIKAAKSDINLVAPGVKVTQRQRKIRYGKTNK